MANYVTGSQIGVNLANVDAVGSPQFNQGTTVNASGDSLFVYCETIGTFTTGMVGMLSTGGTATLVSLSAGGLWPNGMLGFAQQSSTSGQFQWFCQRGLNVYAAISGTCSPSVALYTTATPGVLHSTSASSTIAGVQLIAATSATATIAPQLVNLTWPRWNTASI